MPRTTPPARPLFHPGTGLVPAAPTIAGRRAGPVGCAAGVLAVLVAAVPCHAGEAGAAAAQPVPPLAWTFPFGLLLLAVAVLPVVPGLRHWWELNRVKLAVGVVLGGAVLAHYAARGYGYHGTDAGAPAVVAVLEHALLRDYVPFMTLLVSLFVISGGVRVRGDLRATPTVNTAFLAAGAMGASLVGTTGASMVLIRPLLQTNRDRTRVGHTVVFFIFLVSNVGGCLLPTGDPPLFLGYLQGVPFRWTLTLAGPWAFCVGVLLGVYFAVDTLAYRREGAASRFADARHVSALRVHGGLNLVWLAGVILAVALVVPGRPLPGTGVVAAGYAREALMVALTALSWLTTPRGLRRDTGFSFAAILEVASLFLGIFLTLPVPLEILQARGPGLGVTSPRQFFWVTGALSGVLDNAPTYLVFLETARALPAAPGAPVVALADGVVRHDLLTAVSLGAVFMGGLTYLGNAPNLMVKLVAEERGVRVPGFFGYMAWSGLVLVPLFVVVSRVFLH